MASQLPTEDNGRPSAAHPAHPGIRYRKGSFEARIDYLLPAWPTFDVIAHELWSDGEGLSVNDSWFLGRGCDRDEAISHLLNRWEVFRVNYAPRATVKSIVDANWSGDDFPSLLEADGIPFAEIRKGGDR